MYASVPTSCPKVRLARGLGIGIGGARDAEIDDLGLAGLIHQECCPVSDRDE